jgi:2-polyprenyl-3-methyl-5-hydroxy-6-metoxy-1,4-benzoquinol methylase
LKESPGDAELPGAIRYHGRSCAHQLRPGNWENVCSAIVGLWRNNIVNDWWKSFFDDDYLRIWGQLQTEESNAKQAAELWSMLDLSPGCRILDAPCGWGRLSRPLARLGATVLGVDQSEVLLAVAARTRGEIPPERLRYLRHDLRTPLSETGFDVACNIFTSFGYGTEEEDLEIFRTLRTAVRPGGRVVVETNHRDLTCAHIAHGANASKRLPDGTLFVADSTLDPISGVVRLDWYWSGPGHTGEKHGEWRCYTATQIVDLLRRAGLHFTGAYKGLSKTPYRAEGPDAGGRLAVIGVRED